MIIYAFFFLIYNILYFCCPQKNFRFALATAAAHGPSSSSCRRYNTLQHAPPRLYIHGTGLFFDTYYYLTLVIYIYIYTRVYAQYTIILLYTYYMFIYFIRPVVRRPAVTLVSHSVSPPVRLRPGSINNTLYCELWDSDRGRVLPNTIMHIVGEGKYIYMKIKMTIAKTRTTIVCAINYSLNAHLYRVVYV